MDGAGADSGQDALVNLDGFGSDGCNAILACIDSDCEIAKPGYDACVQACKGGGTRAAQQMFDAYTVCAQQAMAGDCSANCSGGDLGCAGCLSKQCANPYVACQADK